jgi:hypothetical protein
MFESHFCFPVIETPAGDTFCREPNFFWDGRTFVWPQTALPVLGRVASSGLRPELAWADVVGHRLLLQPAFAIERIVSRKFSTPEDRLMWEIFGPDTNRDLWQMLTRHTLGDVGDVDCGLLFRKNCKTLRRPSDARFESRFRINSDTYLRIVTWLRGQRQGKTIIRECPLPVRPSAAASPPG